MVEGGGVKGHGDGCGECRRVFGGVMRDGFQGLQAVFFGKKIPPPSGNNKGNLRATADSTH